MTTPVAASLSQDAVDLTSGGTVLSGDADWSTGATNSAWVLLVIEGPGTVSVDHNGPAGTPTGDTFIEFWVADGPGATFPLMDSWGTSATVSGKASMSATFSSASATTPVYLYVRSSSLNDASQSGFNTDQTTAAVTPISGQVLNWSVPAPAGGGPPVFQGGLHIQQAVEVAFVGSVPTGLELFPEVEVTFAATLTQPNGVEFIGPWTADESRLCNAPVDVSFHAVLQVPPTVPPGGSVDPVTGQVYPGTGEATAFPSPPVRMLVRSSPAFPDPLPLLDPNTGRPDRTRFKQNYAASVVEAVGRLRVVIGGQDVTFFRGPQAKVTNLVTEEPFGSVQATIEFASVSPMEAIGTGALSWLHDGANCDIDLVGPDGTLVANLFEGFIPSVSDRLMSKGLGIEVTAVGSLFQADYIMHQRPLWATPTDTGQVIADILNGVPAHRYAALAPVTTGIPSTDIGSVDDTRLSRVRSLLGGMWTDDGSNQWTIAETGSRKFALRLKDRHTQHWTVTAGVAGVDVTLKRDLTQAPNVIKGSGVDSDQNYYSWLKTPNYVPGRGEVPYPFNSTAEYITIGTTDAMTDSKNGVSTWQAEARRLGYNVDVTGVYTAKDRAACLAIQRAAGGLVTGIVAGQTWNETFNTGKNGGNLDGAYNAPITEDLTVEPYYYTASGAVLANNTTFDPAKLRVETWVHFPDGTSKDAAARSANAQRLRDADPGYSGQITLSVDPVEGSRLMIKAGQNIMVQGHRGAHRLLHIAQVHHDLSVSPFQTTLQVDTQARDAMTLAAVAKRTRDATDLAKRPQGTKSRSAQAAAKPLLDSEMVGYVAATPVFPGLWSKCFVPLGKTGTVVKVELQANPPVEFVAALFGSEVNPAFLVPYAPNPLVKVTDPATGNNVNPFPGSKEFETKLDDALWIETWGGPDEPAGYRTPGKQQGGQLTGELSQPGSWAFDLVQPPWATLMVYSNEPTTISGRIFIAPAV